MTVVTFPLEDALHRCGHGRGHRHAVSLTADKAKRPSQARHVLLDSGGILRLTGPRDGSCDSQIADECFPNDGIGHEGFDDCLGKARRARHGGGAHAVLGLT